MRMTMRRRLAAAAATPAAALSIFVGLLTAPAAAQTGTTPTLTPINWEVVPGALNWTADGGFFLTVGCRTTTHDPTWRTSGGRPRNSILYLHLKLQVPDASDPRGYRDILMYPGAFTKLEESPGARQCNLLEGVDVVKFPIDTTLLRERVALGSRNVLQSLRVVVRYYRPGRFGSHAHEGLHLTNGQFHFFRPGGFTDNVNDGRAAADSEEMLDDF